MLQQERKARRREMLAALIQRELSDIILSTVKDPGCEGTVIVGVKLNSDLSVATMTIRSRNGPEDTTARAVDSLNHGASFMRARLRARLDLKRIPELRFAEDKGIVESVRMGQILDALKEQAPAALAEEEKRQEA
jgi:ribosome-binding factor A